MQSSTRTRPPVMGAAARKVPTSMRSLGTAKSMGASSSTPSMAMVPVPWPSIFAPMRSRPSARATTSGSRAALCITVVPRASTAAIITLAVAPTLEILKLISSPFRRPPFGALAWM